MDLAAALGAQIDDCEAIGEGWLAQPVNAWSSLTISVVGAGITVSAAAASGRDRTDRLIFGALLIATGIGSFLFHGPQPAGARFIHDASFLVALWYLIVANLTGAYSVDRRRAALIGGAGVVAIAAALIIDDDLTNVLTAALAVTLVASDAALWRRAGPSPGWYAVSVGALVVGVALFVAGRSGSPLCDSDALLQAHAGWHALVAGALGAYFFATAPARTGATP